MKHQQHNAPTEPSLTGSTTPMLDGRPRVSWVDRCFRGISSFFAFSMRKINQLLGLVLIVLLLFLFARLILNFFTLTQSMPWVLVISAPLVAPFDNLLPPLTYSGYSIDGATLIAIVVYLLIGTILRQFLALLVGTGLSHPGSPSSSARRTR